MRQYRLLIFLWVCLYAYVPTKGQAQFNQSVKVNHFDCALKADIPKWIRENVSSNVGKKKQVVLLVGTILSAADKQNLSLQHIEILEYLGDKSYSAMVSAKSNFSAFKLIVGIAEFLPQYKINPSILEKSKTSKKITCLVSFHKGITSEEISAFFISKHLSVMPNTWQKRGLYKVELLSEKLLAFASFEGIQYISEVPGNVPLDLDSKGSQGASILNMPNTLGGKGLRGKDVMVGIGDNTSGIYHIDQSDRTINYNNGDKTSHGVFVHSIVGGDGIMDWAGQGIATEGTCISLFFDAVIFLKEELYKGFNMTLTNNSYASVVNNCSYSGTYDNISQNLDSLAFDANGEQLDVFAVGNDGRSACGAYPAGYYNVCGGFQTAKNIISVGATSRDLVLGAGSSRGPLKDGRLKPEMTAAGIDILGAIPENTYQINRGTSFAAPQVTGMLALLTERYKQLNSGANPKSDLLKAIVINGAIDLGRPGPDFLYGFGFLNGLRSIEMIDNNRFKRNIMSSGAAVQSFNITVPANTAQLKVMLYYHDPMASASSSKQLVNDLDLTVTEPFSSIVHRPLVLNSTPSGVANNAVEGVDRLNNIEQVTINNPIAGNYTLSVSDVAIPEGPQEYVVVYDFVPNEIKLMYPIANAAVAAHNDLYIYWDAPFDATSTTKIEFSDNNGSSWTTIAAAVAANQKYYLWPVPSINSHVCRIRITRGSFTDESGPFVIHQKPVINLSTLQCPGAIAINWTAVPNADQYYLLLKKGPHFQKVDSVSSSTLSYVFKGLNTSMDYYVSVQPSLAGKEGYRSNAASRKPNTGNCVGFADGDIALDAVVFPSNGRRSTSLELKKRSPIIIQVRNQDNDPVANYSVSYQVNGSAWKTLTGFSIGSNISAQVLVDSFDFSDTIAYQIKVALNNLDKADPVLTNDTLGKNIKHYPNNIMSLTSTLNNDFEALPDMTLNRDTIGFSRDGYWDYATTNQDTGRMRTRIPGSKLVKSYRSISLDLAVNNHSTANFLTGTFNLSNYDTSIDEVRFDFDYEMRGMPIVRDSNKLWLRGSDLQPWIPVMKYSNVYDADKMRHSGTISLRDMLRYNNQNFSTSTQIRFGQFDTTLIVDDNYGGGLTLDNIKLYKVLKDAQLTRLVSPLPSECDISFSDVTAVIRNGTVNTLKGISVGYTFDGGPAFVESLPDSLKGGDSILHTFSKGLTSLSQGMHSLKVWLHVDGDDFLSNDTIANYVFYNSSRISSFPYLENFETGNGGWYSKGRNASWAHGIPSGTQINTAASGRNVWKTNLNGFYNSNELSYLISPCMVTIGLAKPMLSFSTAFDIERCVAPCDRVFIEYSVDNEETWTRLGNNGKGTNWYNNEVYNVWNGESTRWHVASFELPRASQLKLRFVLATDLGTNLEGIAIDDIHIYDLQNPIIALNSSSKAASTSQEISGNKWLNNVSGDGVFSAINPQGQNLGMLSSSVFAHQSVTDPVQKQYVFPRSFLLQKPSSLATSAQLRLFISDEELQQVWTDTTCPNCTRAADIYRTGITRFVDSSNRYEDSSLANNDAKGKAFFTYKNIQWVPYDNGYYVELPTNQFGEFWLNDGGIIGTLAANTDYVQLKAIRWNDQKAELSWLCNIDTQVVSYKILRSLDSVTFTEIDEVISLQKDKNNYFYLDNPKPQLDQKVFYQLLCTAKNGKTFYSNIASVQWTKGNQLLGVYPVPSVDGNISLKWTAAVGSIASCNLTDIAGKAVWNSEIKAVNWLNETILPLGFLAKGMYFLKIQIGDNQYQEKIIFK
jgi:hypothetical protein